MAGFAVVIVNYRSAGMARRCAELAAADGPEQVLIVDNDSRDGSADELRAAGLEVLARPVNDGFAAGVNAGFAATTAPVVVLLNPDCEPRPGALRALAGHLSRAPEAGVAAPRLVFGDGTPQASAYRHPFGMATLLANLALPVMLVREHLRSLERNALPPEAFVTGTRVAHVMGAALAVRRAAYDAAGPLDDGFFLYLEETEWQERVRRAGFTVELVAESEVVHLVRGGEGEHAPSPHYVASARRYLRLRGHRPRTVDAALWLALASSRLTARAWERLKPRGGERVRAWDAAAAGRRR